MLDETQIILIVFRELNHLILHKLKGSLKSACHKIKGENKK